MGLWRRSYRGCSGRERGFQSLGGTAGPEGQRGTAGGEARACYGAFWTSEAVSGGRTPL